MQTFVRRWLRNNTELAWIFNTITPSASSSGRTQFKARKAERRAYRRGFSTIGDSGRRNSPVSAEFVSVGEDQLRTWCSRTVLEMERAMRQEVLWETLTRRWRARCAGFFPEPQGLSLSRAASGRAAEQDVEGARKNGGLAQSRKHMGKAPPGRTIQAQRAPSGHYRGRNIYQRKRLSVLPHRRARCGPVQHSRLGASTARKC